MCNDDKFDENLPPPFFINNDPSSIKSKKFERLIRLSFAETFSLTVSETVIISIGGRGGSRMSGVGGLNNVRGGWAIARWTTLFNAIISQLHLTHSVSNGAAATLSAGKRRQHQKRSSEFRFDAHRHQGFEENYVRITKEFFTRNYCFLAIESQRLLSICLTTTIKRMLKNVVRNRAKTNINFFHTWNDWKAIWKVVAMKVYLW